MGKKITGAFGLLVAAALFAGALVAPEDASAQQQGQPSPAQVPPAAPALEWDPNDPRIGLGAGWMDAESAISGLELLAAIPRPDGFFNPSEAQETDARHGPLIVTVVGSPRLTVGDQCLFVVVGLDVQSAEHGKRAAVAGCQVLTRYSLCFAWPSA